MLQCVFLLITWCRNVGIQRKFTISSHAQESRTLRHHARLPSSLDTNLLRQEVFLCWPNCVTLNSLYCSLPQLGHPIVGDVKYGAPQTFKTRDIALHAYALTVAHPITAIEVKYLSNYTFYFCSRILSSTNFTLIPHISRSLFGHLLSLSHLPVESRELWPQLNLRYCSRSWLHKKHDIHSAGPFSPINSTLLLPSFLRLGVPSSSPRCDLPHLLLSLG